MIDIHNHALYGVDDGAAVIEDSIKMIDQAISIGITDIILTPHYSHTYQKLDINDNFNTLKEAVKDKPITLHLGREYRYSELKPLKAFTMGNSNYMLIEFSTLTHHNIEEVCYTLKTQGIYPIIAHIERYHYLSKEDYKNIKEVALIQVNANAVIGLSSFKKDVKIARYLLKHRLVDIVASDAHDTIRRGNNLDKAYRYIQKKYSLDYAKDVCHNNPQKIISKHTTS